MRAGLIHRFCGEVVTETAAFPTYKLQQNEKIFDVIETIEL